MARCEDWPACGHELGLCPDFDDETGEQINMKCVCGAVLPVDHPSSCCDRCLHDPDCPGCDSRFCANRLEDYGGDEYDDEEEPDFDD